MLRVRRTAALVATVTTAAALLLPAASGRAAPTPGHPVDLGTFGGTHSAAVAVDGSTVVGWAEVPDAGPVRHAFAYDADGTAGLHDLGTLGGAESAATGVSGHRVVGWADTAGGRRHAFVYDLDHPGMVDLGTLGGDSSAATAVDGATVVGWSEFQPGDDAHRAFAVDTGTARRALQDVGAGDATDVSADLVTVDDGTSGTLYRLGGATAGPIQVLPSDESGHDARSLAVDAGIAVGVVTSGTGSEPVAFSFAADSPSGGLRMPLFPAPSAALDVSGGYALGWVGAGADRRAVATDVRDPAGATVDLGAWTPISLDGTVAVGQAATGDAVVANLAWRAPRPVPLPGLGGRSTAVDVSAGLVAGSSDTRDGATHATIWRVFQDGVLTNRLARSSIVVGRSTRLVAKFAVAGAEPIADRLLSLYYRASGRAAWRYLHSERTGYNGRATFRVAPRRNTDYQVRFDGDAGWGPTRARPVALSVQPRIGAWLSSTHVRPGTVVRLSGRVSPASRVWLQTFTDDGWRELRSQRPSRRGLVSFRIERRDRGSFYYRLVTHPTTARIAGTSSLRTIHVRVPKPVTRELSRLPNIVMVLTDDQRLDTLAQMPNVQSLLVDRGRTFTSAFTPVPICCPSRSTILTGRYAHDTGVYGNYGVNGGWAAFRRNGNEERTIAVALQRHGYRTALIGKYLNGYESSPMGFAPDGWDRFLGLRDGHRGYYYNYMLADGETFGSKPRDYSTLVYRRRATAFINATPPGRPLFLYLSLPAPHPPYLAAPHDVGTWEGQLPSYHPPSVDDDLSGKPQWMSALEPIPQEEIDRVRSAQQDALIAVDQTVAALVTALGDTGRLRNTMLVFTSDNGFLWGDHRLTGKAVPYTPAMAVPLIVRWDGLVDAGSVDDRIALNADFARTMAHAAGIRFPSDGRDLLGDRHRSGMLLEGADWAGRRRTAGSAPTAGRSCATRRVRASFTTWRPTRGSSRTLPATHRSPRSRPTLSSAPVTPARRPRPASPGNDPPAGRRQWAAAPMASYSSSDSSISAAAQLSSRCATDDVPGIGSITGDRRSSHASASWEGARSCCSAARSSGPPWRASLPVASGNHGMNPMPCSVQ